MLSLLLWGGYGFWFNIGAIDGLACQVREILASGLWGRRRAFEETDPPGGRIKRTVVVVQRRVHVVEEVPDCMTLAEGYTQVRRGRTVAHDDAAHLVLGYRSVHDERKAQKHPGQIRRLEDEYAQEAELRIRVLPTPDIDQCAGKSRAEECHGEQRSHAQKQRRCKGKKP